VDAILSFLKKINEWLATAIASVL